MEVTDEQLKEALNNLYKNMLDNTVDPDPEISKIMSEDFWEMMTNEGFDKQEEV